MKKTRTILLLLFSLFFFSKSLIYTQADLSKSLCCSIELEQQEPLEKSGKDPLDEKDKSEDWINPSQLVVINSASGPVFRCYEEIGFRIPYFEIYSPPPELNFLS